MDDEDQKEIKDIVHFLDDFPNLNLRINNKESSVFKDTESKNDYASLITIKTLKQKPEYYLAKWNFMMKNLIYFDEYFYYFCKKEVNINAKQTSTSRANKKKKKNIKNNSSNISSNTISNSSSEIVSGEQNSTQSKNSIISTQFISDDFQNNEMNGFKLHYVRKNIQDINFDNIDGKDYENYAKRTIFAMLMLIKVYNFEILHPKNALYNKLMNISKIEKNENINDTFEVDMVINGLLLNDIKILINQYPKHFFFVDQLKIREKHINDKVNIVSQISKDLIKDIKDKLEQEQKYINILKAFDKYRTEEILTILTDDNQMILNSFLIEVNNENIFIFIIFIT